MYSFLKSTEAIGSSVAGYEMFPISEDNDVYVTGSMAEAIEHYTASLRLESQANASKPKTPGSDRLKEKQPKKVAKKKTTKRRSPSVSCDAVVA